MDIAENYTKLTADDLEDYIGNAALVVISNGTFQEVSNPVDVSTIDFRPNKQPFTHTPFFKIKGGESM